MNPKFILVMILCFFNKVWPLSSAPFPAHAQSLPACPPPPPLPRLQDCMLFYLQ